MILQERLQHALEELGCTRIPEILYLCAEEASKHNISYLEFLDKLLQEELVAKHERFIKVKTRLAHLPYRKTLEEFDFHFQTSIDERRIRDLATLQFVEHRENLIFLGPPGVGNYRKNLVMERN
jgi:DNA replication protein DnaC